MATKSRNQVCLVNWYDQPIHCPFCGSPLAPPETDVCKHLLYIIHGGNFIARDVRFDLALGIVPGSGDWWPEFGGDEKAKYGSPHMAAQSVLANFVNSIEYQLEDPGDVALIGFAPLDVALCGWAINPQCPLS